MAGTGTGTVYRDCDGLDTNGGLSRDNMKVEAKISVAEMPSWSPLRPWYPP